MSDIDRLGLRYNYDQATGQVDPTGGVGSMERGLRSSLYGMDAGSSAVEGLKAEIAGDNQRATQAYDELARLQGRQQQWSPEVGSLKDVHGASDLAEFTAGGLPQVVTSMAPSLLATVAGRALLGRFGSLAGLIPAYNMEAEETAGQLAQNKEARANMTPEQILRLARAKGLVNAGLEVAPQAWAAERAFSKLARAGGAKAAAGTVAGEALGEAATEGLQELTGQMATGYAKKNDVTSDIDPWGIADAAYLGGIGGGVMTTPLAAGQYVGSKLDQAGEIGDKAAKAGHEALDTAKEAAQPYIDKLVPHGEVALEQAKEVGGTVLDKGGNLVERMRNKATDAYDESRMNWLIGKNEDIPSEIAKDPQAIMEHLSKQDVARKDYAADYLNKILESDASPERKAAAKNMMDNLDKPEAFSKVASAIAGVEKAKNYANMTETFLEDAAGDGYEFAKGLATGKEIKKNAQAANLSATDQLITNVLTENMSEEAKAGGVEKLLPFFRGMFNGSAPKSVHDKIMRDFVSTYGENATIVAAQAAQLGYRSDAKNSMTPTQATKYVESFITGADAQIDMKNATIDRAMTNEARLHAEQQLGRKLTKSDLGVLSDAMSDYVSGAHPKHAAALEKELRAVLGDQFGRVENTFRTLHDTNAKNKATIFGLSEENPEDGFESALHESKMAGEGTKYSLANKDTNGIGKLFDSEDAAKERIEKGMGGKLYGRVATPIRGDEYAMMRGVDPRDLAAQYDKSFADKEEIGAAAADQIRAAAALLRDKYAIKTDVATNPVEEALSEDEVAKIVETSRLPVEKVAARGDTEEGRFYYSPDKKNGGFWKIDKKPRASDGYFFVARGTTALVHDADASSTEVQRSVSTGPSGETEFQPIRIKAVIAAMRKKANAAKIETSAEGDGKTLELALGGIARLDDSGTLNHEGGAYAYDEAGKAHWLIAPKGSGKKSGGISTIGDLAELFKANEKRKAVVAKATEKALLAKGYESALELSEDDRDLLVEKNDELEAAMRKAEVASKADPKNEELKRAWFDTAYELRKYNDDPLAYIGRGLKKEQEAKPASETATSSDTDPVLKQLALEQEGTRVSEAEQFDHTHGDVFNDVQFRSRNEMKGAPRTPDLPLAPRIKALADGISAAKLPAPAKNKALAILRDAYRLGQQGKKDAANKLYTTQLEKFGQYATPVITEAAKAPVKKSEQQESQQRADKPRDMLGRQDAIEYIAKVLGDNVALEFKNTLGGHSGEWEKGDTVNTIRIALTAGPGVLAVAYHESVHELMDKLTKAGREDIKKVLIDAANSPTVRRRLERLLDGEDEALAAMRKDPEERLAYMYQFWADGQLIVGDQTEGVFHTIKRFVKTVLKMLNDNDRTELLFNLFESGAFSDEKGLKAALELVSKEDASLIPEKLKPLFDKAYALAMPAADVLDNADNPAATTLRRKLYTPTVGPATVEMGFLNATRAKTAEWSNRFADTLSAIEPDEVEKLREHLSAGTKTNFRPVLAAARDIRKLLDDFHDYMQKRGVDVSYRKDYFPRVWDFQKINENKDAFIKLLSTKYAADMQRMADEQNDELKRIGVPDRVAPEDMAKRIVDHMANLSGVETEHGDLREGKSSAGYTPFMQAVNEMRLTFIYDADVQDYLQKDLVHIMSSYLKQGVRRAEYEHRFGAKGKEMSELLVQAREHEINRVVDAAGLKEAFEAERKAEEGKAKLAEAAGKKYEAPSLDSMVLKVAGADEGKKLLDKAVGAYSRIVDAVHGIEGTIGHDKITPGWRKFNSWMMAYQSLRLLPLSLFSSMIDPLGIMVRGGELSESLAAYKRGLKEVVKGWKGDSSQDALAKTAELLGVIEQQSFLDAMGYVQESMYMDSKAKRISDKLFRWNGMEAWNRAMRTQATAAAIEFIKDHGNNIDPEHSERWLNELGLRFKDVEYKADGELMLWKEEFNAKFLKEGVHPAMAEIKAQMAADKMQLAVNQWVDGAMLRPNAAVRPAWSSDPRFSLLFYLKQFTYTFHKTFINRARNEFRHGNTQPVLMMLPFVPVVIASDVVRGMLTNAGDLPPYMRGWGPGDYVAHGVQRAGLLGMAQFGADEIAHPTDLLGPVVGQAVDLFTQTSGKNIREAIPGLSMTNINLD